MDAAQRLARLEQRIAELATGKDIDAAHINTLAEINSGIFIA